VAIDILAAAAAAAAGGMGISAVPRRAAAATGTAREAAIIQITEKEKGREPGEGEGA
jgi:DNA-binding transcriptional LysR family regulator